MKLPKNHTFVPVRPTSRLRSGMWWKEGRKYVRVWPDEFGRLVWEMSDRYDTKPVAVRIVRVPR